MRWLEDLQVYWKTTEFVCLSYRPTTESSNDAEHRIFHDSANDALGADKFVSGSSDSLSDQLHASTDSSKVNKRIKSDRKNLEFTLKDEVIIESMLLPSVWKSTDQTKRPKTSETVTGTQRSSIASHAISSYGFHVSSSYESHISPSYCSHVSPSTSESRVSLSTPESSVSPTQTSSDQLLDSDSELSQEVLNVLNQYVDLQQQTTPLTLYQDNIAIGNRRQNFLIRGLARKTGLAGHQVRA